MKNLFQNRVNNSNVKMGSKSTFQSLKQGRILANCSSFAFAVLIFFMSSFTGGPGADAKIKLTFVDHLQAGLIEQDVFVEKVKGSGEVYRVLPTERDMYMDYTLYKTNKAQKHDPFDANNGGPFVIGDPIGMTLREWLQAKGSAEYACENGWGVLNAEFENLVPNATYTMWHFFMSAPPTIPFNGTIDVPLGDRDGTQSVFVADAKGKANIQVRFENCLQLSNVQTMGGLAIAYHSDGKTYGGAAGDFGAVTHVQLFSMLPDARDVK